MAHFEMTVDNSKWLQPTLNNSACFFEIASNKTQAQLKISQSVADYSLRLKELYEPWISGL